MSETKNGTLTELSIADDGLGEILTDVTINLVC
jgi:hypothetical protein